MAYSCSTEGEAFTVKSMQSCMESKNAWNEAGLRAVIEPRLQNFSTMTEAEWNAVNIIQQSHTVAATVLVIMQWQRPAIGWSKCNVDARASGWGWCVRNDQGQFIQAESSWNRANLTIIEGEAMTLLEAIRAAIN
ncbi:eukaryotic translation initiation factor 3 subunit c [Trifolium pratense]|uniref:Eukaryotic translation initiation factor 3 subunit c n=1 Tax=Trifolium pratense TaxID=57577 RepID=A0A2K3LWI0_TRIPR|nr:eukaryotic translation initiation factor 3 subunit c [Trifolium pratense]